MQYKAPPNTNTSTQSNSTLLQSVFSKSYLALSIAFVCHYKMFGNVTCLLRILGKWLVLTFAREQPVSMKWCHLHPIRSQFDILFPNIPLLLCNYPHLRAFEVRLWKYAKYLENNDYRKTLSFSKYLRNKSSNLYEILNWSSNYGVMCTFLGVQTPPTPPTLMDSNRIFSLI